MNKDFKRVVMKERILVIFGGKSVEHDISIITAMQVLKQLPKSLDCVPIYIDRVGLWWIADNLFDIEIYSDFKKLAKKRKQVTLILGEKVVAVKKGNKFVPQFGVETVLNCCHGNIGEDGAMQGVLKTCAIPTTSSGVTSSALCMDKVFMKDILKANDILSPKYVSFDRCTYSQTKEKVMKNVSNKIEFPLIVKPANLGSSIGISVCHKESELEKAVELALMFDEKILIEKLVENLREFNCACFFFKGRFFTSNVNEVRNKKEIYSFEDKYLSKKDGNQEVDKTLAKKVQSLTEKVYKLFDCKGIVRVDFLFDEKTEILYVNEINTIPGSLAFYLFKDITFKDLLISMMEESKLDAEREKNLTVSFESDALKIFENVSASLKK